MYLDQEITQAATKLSDVLVQEGKMLITAESCTGGLIGSACTDIAGSSSWFYGGIISYDNHAKETLLGVSKATLMNHGAVSKATVVEMCRGALEHGGDISIAVSGVAGPGGGTPDKPVGTVVIGCMLKGYSPKVTEFHFAGDRAKVRELTVLKGLEALQYLLENKE